MKKALKIASAALQVLLLLLVLVLLVPKILGYQQYTVLTGSMTPTLPVGSMIVVQGVDFAAVETGDIISYRVGNGSDIVTHRVVDIVDEGLVTRGDANNTEDANPVTADRLLGRVLFHIPLLGYVSLFVNRVGPVALILGLAAIYLLVGVLPRLLLQKEESSPEAEDASPQS